MAGRVLKAEGDLMVIGLSVVRGGPLEYERRIAKAWPAFYAQGGRLTSKRLPVGTWWERWFRHVSRLFWPSEGRGGSGTTCRVDATANRMIRNLKKRLG